MSSAKPQYTGRYFELYSIEENIDFSPHASHRQLAWETTFDPDGSFSILQKL